MRITCGIFIQWMKANASWVKDIFVSALYLYFDRKINRQISHNGGIQLMSES